MTKVFKLPITVFLSIQMIWLVGSIANGAYAAVIKLSADTAKRVQSQTDKILLDKFEVLSKKMSDVKGSYTMAGVINITDHARPGDKMDNVKFMFCKKGDEFYYRLGTTASINEQGVYLYIDYQVKRILVSEQKEVRYDNGLKGFADLGAGIRSENYRITGKVSGNSETISLINEHHISCKQYSITFNRADMKIKRLYMRLTNFNNPLRTDNEKIVDVSITDWNSTADLKKYLSKNDIIKNVNGGWETVNAYKNYQLTKM